MVTCFILWKLLAFYTSCNSVKVVFYEGLTKTRLYVNACAIVVQALLLCFVKVSTTSF
nr:MAG TPA: hypothetical protein [Caudoviricetes sp.]